MKPLRAMIGGFALSLFAGLPGFAADLVMVEQRGCHWCARWNEEISHIYPKTEEGQRAPLRRVDIHEMPDDLTLTSKPVFTPTFILVQDGVELGRIEGYSGDEFFWFLLTRLLDEHPQAALSN